MDVLLQVCVRRDNMILRTDHGLYQIWLIRSVLVPLPIQYEHLPDTNIVITKAIIVCCVSKKKKTDRQTQTMFYIYTKTYVKNVYQFTHLWLSRAGRYCVLLVFCRTTLPSNSKELIKQLKRLSLQWQFTGTMKFLIRRVKAKRHKRGVSSLASTRCINMCKHSRRDSL